MARVVQRVSVVRTLSSRTGLVLSLLGLAACGNATRCDVSPAAHVEEGYCDDTGQAFCLSEHPIPF